MNTQYTMHDFYTKQALQAKGTTAVRMFGPRVSTFCALFLPRGFSLNRQEVSRESCYTGT